MATHLWHENAVVANSSGRSMNAENPEPEGKPPPSANYLHGSAGPAGMIVLAIFVVIIAIWVFYVLQSASTIHLAFPERGYTQATTAYAPPEAYGSDVALYRAGNAALYGKGTKQDDARAFALYQRGAAHGDADCEYSLAYMYSEGRGTSRDLALAFDWMLRAAQQGHALAQDNLGVAYGDGRGVAPDWVQSYLWIDLAAKQGNAQAIKDLEYARARMTPAQVSQAKALSDAWQPTRNSTVTPDRQF